MEALEKMSSVHVDNKNKDTLILGEGPTQELDDTALKTETKYPIHPIFATKIYQFKVKDSEIKTYPLCLGNISKDSTFNNMKKKKKKKNNQD